MTPQQQQQRQQQQISVGKELKASHLEAIVQHLSKLTSGCGLRFTVVVPTSSPQITAEQ